MGQKARKILTAIFDTYAAEPAMLAEADGIEMANAEIPPGTHYLRINLKDKQDRTSTTTIKLVVAPTTR
jgi:hypothetical protein